MECSSSRHDDCLLNISGQPYFCGATFICFDCLESGWVAQQGTAWQSVVPNALQNESALLENDQSGLLDVVKAVSNGETFSFEVCFLSIFFITRTRTTNTLTVRTVLEKNLFKKFFFCNKKITPHSLLLLNRFSNVIQVMGQVVKKLFLHRYVDGDIIICPTLSNACNYLVEVSFNYYTSCPIDYNIGTKTRKIYQKFVF